MVRNIFPILLTLIDFIKYKKQSSKIKFIWSSLVYPLMLIYKLTFFNLKVLPSFDISLTKAAN